MRLCSSCGRENPDDRDFCGCGEYLRWDPTGVVQAITPEMLRPAPSAERPATAEPKSAAPLPPAPAPAAAQQPSLAPRASRAPAPTARYPAAPAPARVPAPAEPDPAAISLRLPEAGHGDLGATLAVGVEPGGRVRVLALVRNQSGIVDNYELS